MKSILKPLLLAALILPTAAQAMTIGYYDSSREDWGFSAQGPYLSKAKQWLVDQGHVLVATNNADSTFLSGVDAFYTGLVKNINNTEISAMQNFVDNQGGFLFIQQDHDSGNWFNANNQILANWGISTSGTYYNDAGHQTVGSSSWVTDPNVVNGFTGAAHSTVTSAPTDFEILAKDSLGRTIIGVFDAGGGRSSDVLIATDINFWDDSYGWTNAANRALWENIWTSANQQTSNVPEPTPIALFGLGLLLLTIRKYKKS